jgi:radical SAM protein with 4Fe4S-binding SPASM domain
MDSHVPAMHDFLRRRAGTLKSVTHSIRTLKEINKSVSVAFCANALNYKHLEGVVDLAARLGVDAVLIGEVLSVCGNDAQQEKLLFAPSDYREFIRTAVRLRAEYSNSLPVHISTEWGFLFSDKVDHSPCSALDRDMAIFYDGYAYPCPFIRNTLWRLGDVSSEPLRAIWTGPKAELFRNSKHRGCSARCPFYSRCLSGCKAPFANNSEALDQPDKRCPFLTDEH